MLAFGYREIISNRDQCSNARLARQLTGGPIIGHSRAQCRWQLSVGPSRPERHVPVAVVRAPGILAATSLKFRYLKISVHFRRRHVIIWECESTRRCIMAAGLFCRGQGGVNLN